MSRFFLGRPIFAWVIAIVIMLAGILSITRLPVSQYPQIAPPQVTITATYRALRPKPLKYDYATGRTSDDRFGWLFVYGL